MLGEGNEVPFGKNLRASSWEESELAFGCGNIVFVDVGDRCTAVSHSEFC